MSIQTMWTQERTNIALMIYPGETNYIRLSNALTFNTDYTLEGYDQVLTLDENGAVKARMTDLSWNAFKMSLRRLAAEDYRAYAYAQYEQRVAHFLPHPFVTVDTAGLIKSLTAAKTDYKADNPNAFAIRLQTGNRKADNELMVTLPDTLAGYAIEVNFSYLLDLLYVLRNWKVKTLKLRILPVAFGISSATRSILEIRDEKDVYHLNSGTALDLI